MDIITALIPMHINIEKEDFKIIDKFCLDVETEKKSLEKFIKKYCEEYKIGKENEKVVSEYIIEKFNTSKKEIQRLSIFEYGDLIEKINIDLVIDDIRYEDQFLWNIYDPRANPEEFAKGICNDLDLPRTFISEISFVLREKILKLRKDYMMKKKTKKDYNTRSKNENNSNKDDSEYVLDGHDIYNSKFLRKKREQDNWTPKISFFLNKEKRGNGLQRLSSLDIIQNIRKRKESELNDSMNKEKKSKIKVHFKLSKQKI